MRGDQSPCHAQELSILDYPLVHHPAPIKAAAALLSAVSFQTKTLRPYLDEIKVLTRSRSFNICSGVGGHVALGHSTMTPAGMKCL